MRLFVAINFNDTTRSNLIGLCDELRLQSRGGNFTHRENLHLTLAFIGECDANQTTKIKSVIDSIEFKAFDIEVNCLGNFKRDGGDIWWAGIKENMTLLNLQKELNYKLIESGFGLEKRRFSPHITLGRKVITNAKPWKFKAFGETIHTLDLMKSERIKGKLTYTSIHQNSNIKD